MPNAIQLKVFLTKNIRQEDPGIYRRLLIPDNITFYDLHCMIQVSLGWCGVGLHEFRDFFDKDDLICNDYDSAGGPHGMVHHSQLYKIKGYLTPNTLISYNYLSEDNFQWQTILFVEDLLQKEEGLTYPLCVAGNRNGPPEDCGGWEGYNDLVKAMKKQKGELYKRYIDLFRVPYNPEYFDTNIINHHLANWRQFKRQWSKHNGK